MLDVIVALLIVVEVVVARERSVDASLRMLYGLPWLATEHEREQSSQTWALVIVFSPRLASEASPHRSVSCQSKHQALMRMCW